MLRSSFALCRNASVSNFLMVFNFSHTVSTGLSMYNLFELSIEIRQCCKSRAEGSKEGRGVGGGLSIPRNSGVSGMVTRRCEARQAT